MFVCLQLQGTSDTMKDFEMINATREAALLGVANFQMQLFTGTVRRMSSYQSHEGNHVAILKRMLFVLNYQVFFSLFPSYLHLFQGYTVAQLVQALRYMPEGRGFNSRWCHWNFSVT